jgi:hypothetical protein
MKLKRYSLAGVLLILIAVAVMAAVIEVPLAPAFTPAVQGVVGGGGAAAGCVAGTTNACKSATVGECDTVYLACEDFDGGVTCGDGTSVCRAAWTTWDVWPNFDATALTSEGTYSMAMDVSGSNMPNRAITAGSPRYFFTKIKVTKLTLASEDTRFINFGDGSEERCYVTLQTGATTSLFNLYAVAYGGNPGTSHSYDKNTEYNIWLEYTKGTGSNARCDLYVSTTGTKGSAVSSSTDGTATQNVSLIGFQINTTYTNATVDHVRAGATQMSGVPD